MKVVSLKKHCWFVGSLGWMSVLCFFSIGST